jgi:hypothetical protein
MKYHHIITYIDNVFTLFKQHLVYPRRIPLHVSVITDKKFNIICHGVSCPNTQYKLCHSEVMALQKLEKCISNHKIQRKTIRKGLYMFNIGKHISSGTYKISKPCFDCSKLLNKYNYLIHGVYWMNIHLHFVYNRCINIQNDIKCLAYQTTFTTK